MTDIRDVARGTLVLPGEGVPIRMGALPVDLLVPAAFSAGAYELHEQPVPPGVLVVPHTHTHQDQISVVTRGTLGVLVGDEEFVAPAGSCVLRPRGIVHALWNASPEPARMIEVSSPDAGIEEFFRRFTDLTAADRATSLAIAELARPYGITYRPDLVPGLEARHGVSAGGGWWRE
jgi:mannose-6-phosphate isomerase-like protein (cupin superfamily)